MRSSIIQMLQMMMNSENNESLWAILLFRKTRLTFESFKKKVLRLSRFRNSNFLGHKQFLSNITDGKRVTFVKLF